MDNLLFYALLIALALYFFYYLPAQKKTTHPNPFKPSKSTQTEPVINEYEPGPESFLNCPSDLSIPDQQELESTLDHLIKEMKDLNDSL